MSSYRRDLVKLADRLGWSVGHTNSGHFKLTHPSIGQTIFCSSSPSDRVRALRNIRGDLQRLMRHHNIPLPPR